MNSFGHLARNGNAYRLVHYLIQSESTIVSGGHYLFEEPGTPVFDRVCPDLLVSFNTDPTPGPTGTATPTSSRIGRNSATHRSACEWRRLPSAHLNSRTVA